MDVLKLKNIVFIFTDFDYSHWPALGAVRSKVVNNRVQVCV